MNSLIELTEMAKNLSDRLEKVSNDDLSFNLQLRLEQMSWETYRMANELKNLREWLVG